MKKYFHDGDLWGLFKAGSVILSKGSELNKSLLDVLTSYQLIQLLKRSDIDRMVAVTFLETLFFSINNRGVVSSTKL